MSNLRTMKILTNETEGTLRQEQNININMTNKPDDEQPYSNLYPSVAPYQTRDINLENNDNKDKQIKVLETILECYANNPLLIDKLVVVKSKKLIELITLMTDADKVEITYDDQYNKGLGCCGISGKIFFIQKIFITKNNKVNDFKYGYLDDYSLLKKYNISLKITY